MTNKSNDKKPELAAVKGGKAEESVAAPVNPFQEAANKEIDELIVDTGIALDAEAYKRFTKMRDGYKIADDTYRAATEHYHKTVARLDRTRDTFWAVLAEENDLDLKDKSCTYAINTDQKKARVMRMPTQEQVNEIVQRHTNAQKAAEQEIAKAGGELIEAEAECSTEEPGALEKKIEEELEKLTPEQQADLAAKLKAGEGLNG